MSTWTIDYSMTTMNLSNLVLKDVFCAEELIVSCRVTILDQGRCGNLVSGQTCLSQSLGLPTFDFGLNLRNKSCVNCRYPKC
jgi:hypothetical protein